MAEHMHMTVLIGLTLDLWPHNSAELSALCGISTAFHSQFSLFFPHTSSSVPNLNTCFLLHIQLSWFYISLRSRTGQQGISLYFLGRTESSPCIPATPPVVDLSFLSTANPPRGRQHPPPPAYMRALCLWFYLCRIVLINKYTSLYKYHLFKNLFSLARAVWLSG